jgi:CBS domain-containing protein
MKAFGTVIWLDRPTKSFWRRVTDTKHALLEARFDLVRINEQLGVGALPVWQDGQSLGLVTDRDICCRLVGAGKDPAKIPVREIMTGVAATCFEDQDCKEAAGDDKQRPATPNGH